ncbi:MAG: hypothetical protein NT049_16610 [Planctomycetota bacterium]|nr:hypothetical protein [Planctomycetota bacterium]
MRIIRHLSIAAVLAALLAGAVDALAEAAGDAFLKGLQERGLMTLQKAYLEKQGVGAQTSTGTGQTPGTGAAAGGDKAALASIEVQTGLKNTNMGEREVSFKKARTLYEGAIEDTTKAAAAIPVGQKPEERDRLRLQALRLRMDLAAFVFEKWLKADIEYLEVTDRRGGNRARAVELFRTCLTQYKAIIEETTAWLSDIDRMSMPERNKFANTGAERNLKQWQRDAKYREAWVTYYLGWALPTDFKPEGKERSRQDLLNDAITAFQENTTNKVSDKASPKWYSYMVIGLAYRELGKYKEALEALAQAERLTDAALKAPPPKEGGPSAAAQAAQGLRIRLAYERPLTLVRKGDFEQARKAIDDATAAWGDKLNTEPLGQALPLVKAESYILEGKQKDDKALKEEGVKILQQMYTKKGPWQQVVQWMMDGLLGSGPTQTVDTTNMDPFQIWIKANEALDKAQKTKDVKDCETALDLYKKYAEKVGPQDKKYPDALYSQAACLRQVGRKAEAGVLFRKVADEYPAYQYALPSARLAVSCFGDAYEREATEENRQAYEDTLKWFVSKFLKEDPEQQFYYAMMLFRGKKFADAADAFGRVPEGSEHAPDAKYWVPLCHLEQFREQVIASRDKGLILSRARSVSQELLAFADYAMQAKGLPEPKKNQLMAWAEIAYVNAADVCLYPEVDLPDDGLKILEKMEQKFELDDEARGRVLKLRIDGNQRLGKQDEALAILDKFLKVAKPEEVGPVLRGLFKAMTDEVRELVKRGDKDSLALSGRKVEQAKTLGERLIHWIEQTSVPDKALQSENIHYDMAELNLAVGNYDEARKIYHEMGGPKPWEVKKGEPMKYDCVYGLARAYEGLGEKARAEAEAAGTKDFKAAKENYEAAVEIWRVLKDIAEGEGRTVDPNIVWDRRYHMFYCAYRIGQVTQKPEDLQKTADALESMRIIEAPGALGGKDPTLQKRFLDLRGVLPAPTSTK